MNLTGGRLIKASHQIQESGFSRARRTDHRENFSLMHAQTQIIDRAYGFRAAKKYFGDAGKLDNISHSARLP
jgi:hypothetical protein